MPKLRWLTLLAFTATAAHADVVADWAELQTAIGKANETPFGVFDPALNQAYGKVGLAMFEAANAANPRYVSYLKLPRAAAGASDIAAVSAAAPPPNA